MVLVLLLLLYHYKIVMKNETTNENLKGIGDIISFKPYQRNVNKLQLIYQSFFSKYYRSLVDNKMIKKSRYFKENPSFPQISNQIYNEELGF